jgi:hypothetical protein
MGGVCLHRKWPGLRWVRNTGEKRNGRRVGSCKVDSEGAMT